MRGNTNEKTWEDYLLEDVGRICHPLLLHYTAHFCHVLIPVAPWMHMRISCQGHKLLGYFE
jgi:hypothetical protein